MYAAMHVMSCVVFVSSCLVLSRYCLILVAWWFRRLLTEVIPAFSLGVFRVEFDGAYCKHHGFSVYCFGGVVC